MRIITGSYSGDLSWDHGDLSRDLVKSDKFKELFPELKIRKKKDSKSNFQIEYWDETKKKWVNGGSRFSTSVGGTVTGKHAHIIIIDDPLDPNRAVSKAEVNNANHWIDQTLPTRKISKRNTPTILIMQRLAQDDPSGHLLSNKKLKTKHICLPGEIRRYGGYLKPESLRKFYKDDLFDAERMDWEALNELEARLGQYGYAGQIGQSPVPFGGAMFDVEQLIPITELPRGKIEWVRCWDKGGTRGGGDYTSGVKWVSTKTRELKSSCTLLLMYDGGNGPVIHGKKLLGVLLSWTDLMLRYLWNRNRVVGGKKVQKTLLTTWQGIECGLTDLPGERNLGLTH